MNYIVEQTASFAKWHAALRDMRAKVAIARRIERAQNGNLGDIKPVGGGLFVLLLAGGDKSTQQADIQRAIKLAKEV